MPVQAFTLNEIPLLIQRNRVSKSPMINVWWPVPIAIPLKCNIETVTNSSFIAISRPCPGNPALPASFWHIHPCTLLSTLPVSALHKQRTPCLKMPLSTEIQSGQFSSVDPCPSPNIVGVCFPPNIRAKGLLRHLFSGVLPLLYLVESCHYISITMEGLYYIAAKFHLYHFGEVKNK